MPSELKQKMKETKSDVRRPADMTGNFLDITDDIGWCTIADVREFVLSYGTMVLSAGLTHNEMRVWMHLQTTVVHMQMPKELTHEDEDLFLRNSQKALHAFVDFCAGACRLFGEKMCIPSWHQVRAH